MADDSSSASLFGGAGLEGGAQDEVSRAIAIEVVEQQPVPQGVA